MNNLSKDLENVSFAQHGSGSVGSVLLLRSLAPSDCGWYADDARCLIPVSIIKCFQNRAMNSLSVRDDIQWEPILTVPFVKE
jgi:hypothetical protein